MKSQVLIISAEASNSSYVYPIVKKLKEKDIHTFGIGNQEMEKIGFECLGRTEETGVVGLFGYKTYSRLKKIFNAIVEECEKRKPKVAVLLDYPGFNFLLAKKLKKMGIPMIYYIPPQIWAWREKRAEKLKKLFDNIVVLFPFEKTFYKEKGMDVDFFGHPLVQEKQQYVSEEAIKELRERYGLKPEDKVLALMPGSRKKFLKETIEIQIKTVQKVLKKYPNLKVFLLIAPSIEKEYVKSCLTQLNFPITLMKDEPFKMISLAHLVLGNCGTVTLNVGLMEKPMVVMYKTSFLFYHLVDFLKNKKLKFFSITNILLDKEVFPELVYKQGQPEILCKEVCKFLSNESLYKKTQEDLRELSKILKPSNTPVEDKVLNLIEGYL